MLCIIKPPLAVGLGFCVGLSALAHRPRCSHPGQLALALWFT